MKKIAFLDSEGYCNPQSQNLWTRTPMQVLNYAYLLLLLVLLSVMSSSSVVIRGRIRRFKLGNRSLSTIIVHWQQSPYVARAVTLHRVWRGQRSNRDNNRNSLDL